MVQSRLISPYIDHNGAVIWIMYSKHCLIVLMECYGLMMIRLLNSMHIGTMTPITPELN